MWDSQLTVQELSVMMRVGVKPIVFLLNNSGYTIERYLHGEKRKYNDITNWSVPLPLTHRKKPSLLTLSPVIFIGTGRRC
jgi:hypothetical protein